MALTLPDHVNVGDSGHVADTNLIIAALADLDARPGGSTILAGTTTPGVATGAVGNYYLDTDDLVLYGPAKMAPGTQYIETPFDGGDGAGATNNYALRHIFQKAGSVTGIRVRVGAGKVTSGWAVYLWHSDGTMLASKAATGLIAGDWATVAFDTPVSVTAGVTYLASVGIPTGGGVGFSTSFPGLTSGDVRIPVSGEGGTQSPTRYSPSAGSFPSANIGYSSITVAAVFSTGDVLTWPVALKSIPPGGTTGQVLKKTSGADYAVAWVT